MSYFEDRELLMTTRNNAGNTRGRPFQPGNPARPKGARNKVTLVAEALLDDEAEAITRKVIELAKAGDMTAIRLCLERIVPVRREPIAAFTLPKVQSVADSVTAVTAIIEAVADGELTPTEASEMSKVVDGFTRAIEAVDFDERISKLERAK